MDLLEVLPILSGCEILLRLLSQGRKAKNGRGHGSLYTISNVCFYFSFREKNTKNTKDVYIYDCYNFDWYILLNEKKTDDRTLPPSLQRYTLTHIHRHEII